MRAANPAFRLDLLRSLKMHPVLASIITCVSLILLLLYGSTMKPMYEAEALVHVQPDPITLLDESSKPSFDPGKYDSFLQEQIQGMQRPDTITAALGRLPKHVWAEYGSSEEEATQRILAKAKIARVGTSYQVSLMLKGSDPQNVTSVINAITYAYLDLVHKDNHIDIDERTGLLAQERQRVAYELRRDQDEQNALGASLGLANPNGEGDPYEGELTALREQLVQARSAHETAVARAASLKEQTEGHGSALAAEADEAILSDAGLSALKSSISERRATLRGQMSGMTPDNPLRRRDQDELTELDRSLEEMSAKLRVKSERDLQEKLHADLQRTGNLENRISSQLVQRTAAATNATPKLQRAAELNGEVKRLLLRQSEIENAARSLHLEESSLGAVRLTLAAQVPTSPEGNRRQLFLIASFPLALLLGATAATIIHKCDPTIYTKQDVGDTLGFWPLATLPAHDEASEAVIAEDVLRLTGAVTSAYRAKGVRIFLFTTVSAATDIEPLSRMLLDKLRQTGIDACSISLADLLLPVDPEQRVDPEALSSAGHKSVPATQTEPQGFAHLNLALLQVRHGLVLIRASQPFESAETEYIARCADATILVVESAVTTRLELVRAADAAHRLHVPAVGVVLQEMKKRHTIISISKLLNISSRHSRLRRTSFQEKAPLTQMCEVMASTSSENTTASSKQPETSQATQQNNPPGANSGLWTPEERQFKVFVSPPGQPQPIENTPDFCQSAAKSGELIVPSDKTDVCEIAHEKRNPAIASNVSARTVQMETPGGGAEGDFPEAGQQQSISFGSSLMNTENPGLADMQRQSSSNRLGLLSGLSEGWHEKQRKHKESGHSRSSGISQPSVLRICEKSPEKLSLLKEKRLDVISQLHPAQQERLDQSAHSSTSQLGRHEDPANTLLHDNPAERDDLLSRQWKLLSRFQQKRVFFPASSGRSHGNGSRAAI